MRFRARFVAGLLALLAAMGSTAPAQAAPFEVARIYIEYNASGNDLGFHVSLDGEDWTSLKIFRPDGTSIFDLLGRGGYAQLGMTELFFEGAEPSLDEFPLDDLLALFPEGSYRFQAIKVDGTKLNGAARLSHAIPAGPSVQSEVNGSSVVIRWTPVSSSPPGFPVRPISIVGYQVLVDPFEVTLPATASSVTLPPEFVNSLARGDHPFEVLAIDASGNQTITEGSFRTK